MRVYNMRNIKSTDGDIFYESFSAAPEDDDFHDTFETQTDDGSSFYIPTDLLQEQYSGESGDEGEVDSIFDSLRSGYGYMSNYSVGDNTNDDDDDDEDSSSEHSFTAKNSIYNPSMKDHGYSDSSTTNTTMTLSSTSSTRQYPHKDHSLSPTSTLAPAVISSNTSKTSSSYNPKQKSSRANKYHQHMPDMSSTSSASSSSITTDNTHHRTESKLRKEVCQLTSKLAKTMSALDHSNLKVVEYQHLVSELESIIADLQMEKMGFLNKLERYERREEKTRTISSSRTSRTASRTTSRTSSSTTSRTRGTDISTDRGMGMSMGTGSYNDGPAIKMNEVIIKKKQRTKSTKTKKITPLSNNNCKEQQIKSMCMNFQHKLPSRTESETTSSGRFHDCNDMMVNACP